MRTRGVFSGVVVHAVKDELRLQVFVEGLEALRIIQAGGGRGKVLKGGRAVGTGLGQLAHKA